MAYAITFIDREKQEIDVAEDGSLKTTDTLKVDDNLDLFAIGDRVDISDDGKVYPHF